MQLSRLPIVLAGVVAVLLPATLHASSARAAYERALQREREVMEAASDTGPGVGALRDLSRQFEAVARRYPTSGYADNALFKAAQHAEALHARTGLERDRTRARRLYAWLAREYPSSSLARRAARAAAALASPVPAAPDVATGRPAADTPVPRGTAPRAAPVDGLPPTRADAPLPGRGAPGAAPSPPESEDRRASAAASGRDPAQPPRGANRVRDVRREVLTDVVRVVIELDEEVLFRHERLDNPPRLFFDLPDTVVAAAVRASPLRWNDEAVRQVRFGRPAPATTRVVLDLDEAGRHSVFTLYHPFRVVVDLERPRVTRHGPPTSAAAPVAMSAASGPPASPGLEPAAAPSPTTRTAVPQVTLPPPAAVPATAGGPPSAAAIRDIDLEPAPPAPAVDPREIDGRDIGLVDDPTLKSRGADAPNAGSRKTEETTPRAVTAPEPHGGDRAASPGRGTASRGDAPRPPAANASGGFSLARQLGLGVTRVVIDPGHGGRDPGATNGELTEAELVLDVALRLERLLLNQPGIEVILTRRDDRFVALEERTALANRVNADLFLSIHANASRNRAASGVETYVLNFATSPEAEAVAARENASATLSMHSLPDIIRAIATNTKIDESRDLAHLVQTSLVGRLGTKGRPVRDLGVKQAPFVVLIGAQMPSVLAEISFITHPREAQLLRTTAYRDRIAEALADAILKYRRSLKAAETVAAQ